MFEGQQEIHKDPTIQPDLTEKFQKLEQISQKPFRDNTPDRRGEIVADTFYFFKEFLEQNNYKEPSTNVKKEIPGTFNFWFLNLEL